MNSTWLGLLQVFNSVNRLTGRKIYEVEVVTNTDSLTVEGEGEVLTFVARYHFSKVEGACDSVLLVCGLKSRSVRDAALSAWLRSMASEVRRLGAVCVGAFLLAEAGLLNGRTATTHWRCGREMESRFPRVRVQHAQLWVKDGNIYTSAGISAGIDLALSWVEEDCGADGGASGRARVGVVLETVVRSSTQAFGVREAVKLASVLNRLPQTVLIYGIEGKQFSYGAPISLEVEHSVESVAQQLLELVRTTASPAQTARNRA
jgi:transcriptional regulator GlxA family with amidase domain